MNRKQKLKEVIRMGVGRASLCWEPRPEGIFDTTEAEKTVDEIYEMVIKIIGEKSKLSKQAKLIEGIRTVLGRMKKQKEGADSGEMWFVDLAIEALEQADKIINSEGE